MRFAIQLHQHIQILYAPCPKFRFFCQKIRVFVHAGKSYYNISVNSCIFLQLLAPFAPHITEELWHEASNKTSIHQEQWPAYDPALLKDEQATIVIQINGKTRGEVQVPADSDKKTVEDAARAAVSARLKGRKISRVIIVPSRLVNFVASEKD